MPVRVRVAIGGITGVSAALLLGWMILLFVGQPRIVYNAYGDPGGDVRVECGSLAAAGFRQPDLLDENGDGLIFDQISTLRLSPVTTAGIYRDCDQRRTTRAGGMALLALPAAVLAMLTISAWSRSRLSPALAGSDEERSSKLAAGPA